MLEPIPAKIFGNETRAAARSLSLIRLRKQRFVIGYFVFLGSVALRTLLALLAAAAAFFLFRRSILYHAVLPEILSFFRPPAAKTARRKSGRF